MWKLHLIVLEQLKILINYLLSMNISKLQFVSHEIVRTPFNQAWVIPHTSILVLTGVGQFLTLES